MAPYRRDLLRGTFTALVTPFRGDEVDEPALRALVERQIEGGVQGLIPCGTTGESVTLSPAEMTRVIAAVIDQAGGRVPVFAGTGSNSTRRTIELSQQARDLGVDGLMLVCPYYNKPGPAGLEAHFRAVMDAVPLPTMLYNSPGRTGCDLGVSTLARMTDLDPLIGVKEASGNVLRSQAILAHLGDRFQVLAGDDPLTLAVLGVGGHGVVSVTANIAPRLVSRVTEAFAEGRLAEAQRLHHRLVPLHEALFIETNPGPVKAALWMLDGAAPEIRSPLTWPEESSLERIRAVMERVGVAR